MKINRTTLSLIVASLCGAGPTVAFGQDALSEAARSSAGRVGDAVGAPKAQSGASQSISDAGEVKAPAMRSPSDRAAADAYPVTTAARPSGMVAAPGTSDCTSPGCTTPGCDSAGCDSRSSLGSGRMGRVGGKLLGAGHLSNSGNCDSGACGTGGGCDSGAACASGGLLGGFGAACGSGTGCRSPFGSGLGWAESDTLLWWGRGLTNSPVIVGGNSATVLPTNPLLGGYDNPLGTDMLVGLRGNVGFWLDDCQNYGVGGRAWGLISDGNEQVITNGGNSTGISFFNSSLGQPDTYIVNLDRGPFGKNVGEIGVLNDLDVYSGDLYLRALLLGNRCNRVDLLGGYTYLRLDSGYQLRSRIVDGWTDAPPPVTTVTTIVDRFSTKNEFHGGHVGLQSNITRGRFGLGLMGKVAMGNMTSTSNISGSYEQIPPLPSLPDRQNRGLFAQSSNIGTVSRDAFTFIPEMNAKLRYQIGRFQVGVGYTVVVLPEVAMAASQIDTNVDALGILNPPTVAPVNRFNTESYYLHGIDLGVTYNF